MLELQLVYTPIFFVEYDSFTQRDFLNDRIRLMSRGLLALEGQKGEVIDIDIISGTPPEITERGCFAECSAIEQKEVLKSKITEKFTFSKFEVIPVKLTITEVEKIATFEIAKRLGKTFDKKLPDHSTQTKTLTPDIGDVRIVSSKLLNIPVITGIFGYKDRIYRRALQASTNRIIFDNISYCNVGQSHYSSNLVVCDECGNLSCENHRKACTTCGASYCIHHSKPKGIIMKKFYCGKHFPN